MLISCHCSDGLELVSPILQYLPGHGWSDSVTAVLEEIKFHCKVETSGSCSTHVHLSPLNNVPWDIGALRSLCQAILYFENAWEVLLPESRRGNGWCRSNRLRNFQFRDKSDEECYQIIRNCSSVEGRHGLIFLMNPNYDRYRQWNFRNLELGGTGTIECRLGPGIDDFRGCLAWVELIVSFVQAASRGILVQELVQYDATVEGLRDFIENAFVSELNQPQLFAMIFEGKSGAKRPIRDNFPQGDSSTDSLLSFASD